jgi:hypothetical protein
MDSFGTRYAYKMGKKGSPTRKKKSSPKPYKIPMVLANEFDDSPTEEMIGRRRHRPGFSIDPTYTKQIQDLMVRSPKKGGKRRTLRAQFRNSKLFRK